MKDIKSQTQWMAKEDTIIKYLEICRQAVKDEEVFKTFKSHPDYTTVLEHCSKKIGQSYLDVITKKYPFFFSSNCKHFENDQYGLPQTELYNVHGGFVRCSPSTLQYVGVLCNLIDLCRDLDNFKILEIGGGYGGQCKVITDAFQVTNYHIIDLFEPSMLQAKYLDKLNVKNVMTYVDPEFASRQDYDLIISNYALSEILEPLQTQYVEELCLKAKYGYLTCNTKFEAQVLIKDKFPTFTISPDIEGESKENYIITW